MKYVAGHGAEAEKAVVAGGFRLRGSTQSFGIDNDKENQKEVGSRDKRSGEDRMRK